jgi:PAS domain S-box-containing protein
VSSDPAGFASELDRLRAHNAVLRAAARHDDLLQRDAFEELAAALAEHIPLGRLLVVVPEREDQVVYALSLGASSTPAPPFGARYPLPDVAQRGTVMAGGPRICRDTRLGDAVDRITAQSGFLSYVALPIRDPQSEDSVAILAKLVVCFAEIDVAAQVPLELLEQVAALFGSKFRRSLAAARERRLAMILETSGDALLAWSREGKITDANAAAARLTGRARAELIGLPLAELVEDLADVSAASEGGRSVRARLRSTGGAVGLPVAVTVTSVEHDPVVAAHMLVRDISHFVAAEREAAEYLARLCLLEQQHRTLLDNAPLVIFRLDAESGELLYINRRAEQLLGIAQSFACAHPDCLRAAHADEADRQSFDDALQAARRGAPLPAYEANLTRQGAQGVLTASVQIYALTERERVVGIEGILVDISAEHAARLQLVQTDRLTTLGRLAASVAHEINNPAAFLMLGLEHLARSLADPEGEDGVASEAGRREAGKLVQQLSDSLQRIADIVRDLRLFSGPIRQGTGSAPPADVNRAVQSALTLTRNQLVDRARLMVDLEPVPPARIEQGRLAQVIVNLLVNAAQAIPAEGGREHHINVITRTRGAEIEIEVSDTGTGIAPEELTRIWAPFFTTKEAGVGTGLGLSISRDIVERAGGRIEVVSPVFEPAPGGCSGSRFTVRLAVDRASLAPGKSPVKGRVPALDAPARRRRVLVVEDEVQLAGALAQQLSTHHDVRVTNAGARAIELLASDTFDVVLSDVRMPELSGDALYVQVCERYPRYRNSFIFMTGIGVGTDLGRLQELYRRPILEKPFPLERLLEEIAAVEPQPIEPQPIEPQPIEPNSAALPTIEPTSP